MLLINIYIQREKYPERIQKNVEHRQHLQKFFDDLKDDSKKDLMNKKLDGLYWTYWFPSCEDIDNRS